MAEPAASRSAPAAPGLHLPSLAIALAIMLGGTLFPFVMADAAGKADHALAGALLWAMSAGFVRGVGFVPRRAPWCWLFSGTACAAALGLALILKLAHWSP